MTIADSLSVPSESAAMDVDVECVPSTSDVRLDDLPAEVLVRIFRDLDLDSILKAREVNGYLLSVAHFLLATKPSLNIAEEYQTEESPALRWNKLCSFSKFYMPSIEELSFRGANAHLSLSELIQVSWAFPSIISLDISQNEDKLPKVDPDVLFAVPYFKRLQTLKISGLYPMHTVRRGCGNRGEIAFVSQLSAVRRLEMDAPDRWLRAIKERDARFSSLLEISFDLFKSPPEIFVDLAWFIDAHGNLEEITLSGALFASNAQIEQIMRSLCHCSHLKRVTLNNCTCVDIVRQCAEEVTLRTRVVVNGIVTSLRFDPSRMQ